MFIINHNYVAHKVYEMTKDKLNFQWNPGNLFKNIRPDLYGTSHGYDILTHTGKLPALVTGMYNFATIAIMNGQDPSHHIQYMIHYITDSMTIGQIVPKNYGKKDDIYDFLGEFVIPKLTRIPLSYAVISYDAAFAGYLETMVYMYNLYHSLNYKNFIDYTRESLRLSIQISSIFLCTLDKGIK